MGATFLEQKTVDNMSDRLEKLKQQREKLNRAIRKEEAAAKQKARKDNTRRKILDGAMIQKYAETHPDMQTLLDQLREKELKRDEDRALFGLEPLKNSPQDNEAPTEKKESGLVFK